MKKEFKITSENEYYINLKEMNDVDFKNYGRFIKLIHILTLNYVTFTLTFLLTSLLYLPLLFFYKDVYLYLLTIQIIIHPIIYYFYSDKTFDDIREDTSNAQRAYDTILKEKEDEILLER